MRSSQTPHKSLCSRTRAILCLQTASCRPRSRQRAASDWRLLLLTPPPTPSLENAHAHSRSRLGLTGVPLPLLSRLALGKIAELERPRRHPKALGTTSNLLSGSPSSIPCSRSDTCRANEVLQRLAAQQPSNQGGAYAPV